MSSQIILRSASAGSGKTYALTKRYLKLLFNNPLKSVIAMTFTNKATIEMKYKAIDYLKKGALQKDCDGIFDDFQDVKEKSLEILKDIFENYDSFNIGTIDKFKTFILKACSIKLNMSPNYSVEMKHDPFLQLSIDSFIKKAAKNRKQKQMLIDYLDQYIISGKPSWFPKDDILSEMKGVFDKAANYAQEIAVPADISFSKGYSQKCKNIRELSLRLSEALKDKAINKLLAGLEKIQKEDFRKIERFSTYLFKPEIEYKKGIERDSYADELWDEFRNEFTALARFEVFNYYAIYSELYRQIVKEYDEQAQKNEIVVLSDIDKKTLKLFKDGQALIPYELYSEIYCRLSEKYKHFLIDEFQDTNPSQWAVIYCFLKESIDRGGTFFYVGDIKQAIYEFRGADSRIFKNVRKDFSAYEFEEDLLGTNRRSREEIVKFNNLIFSNENLQRGFTENLESSSKKKLDFILDEILSVYKDSKQNLLANNTGGYVEIVLTETEKKNSQNKDEQDDAADDNKVKKLFLGFIDKIKDRFAFKDIAVLCRINDQCQTITSWLSEKNYPFESAQTQSIKNNSIVKEIFSLLLFILSPIDKITFAAFLLGDIFSKKTKLSSQDMENFLFENKTSDSFKSPYVDFRKAYPEIWNECFEDFFSKAGIIAVYELVISILDKFDVLENFPTQRVFIMRFLELIKEFEKDDSGIRNFADYFKNLGQDDKKLLVKTVSAEGVKIMTIHKSKGLQFPVVILPFLNLEAGSADSPYFYVSEDEINLMKFNSTIRNIYDKEISDIYDLEKTQQFLSNINTLYVSMTRAKDELYAIVARNPETKTEREKKKRLIPFTVALMPFNGSDRIVFGQPVLPKDLQKPTPPKSHFDNTGYIDMQKAFEFEGGYASLNIEALKAKESGTIIHYALSRIKSLRDEDLDLRIDEAAAFTVKKFPLENHERIKDELQKIFAVKEIRNIFDYDEKAVSNEKEIIDAFGQTMRTDKIIDDGKEILLYDFKSGDVQNEANKKQLLRYKTNLSEIHPQKTIRAFIVDLSQRKIIELS